MLEKELSTKSAIPGTFLENEVGSRHSVGGATIRIRGKSFVVPSITIDNRVVVRTGIWLRIAAIKDEELINGDSMTNACEFIERVRKSGLHADLFTFAQRVPDTSRRHDFFAEYDNSAALSVISHEAWLKNTEYSIRKGVRKAEKSGVKVCDIEFSRDLLIAIQAIYNETEIRQGRRFWHRHKSLEQVETELGDYLDRSVFLGAYFEDELIGFVKATEVNNTITLTQILSKQKHFDKRPNNALISRCIKLCEERKRDYLIYGSLVYNDPSSTLAEFKRRIGFEAIALPRYFVPLTHKGRLALRLGLHRGLVARMPTPVIHTLRELRNCWYKWWR